MPSGAARTYARRGLLDQPLATAEFLVVDTETNGLRGRRVRAHRGRRGARRRRRAARPLGDARRGARAAVARHPALHRDHAGDGRRGARRPSSMLPELAEQLRGPRARRAQRARSTGACCARRSRARACRGPTRRSLCTVALARRLHPLARQRRLRPLAESLGIEVEVTHRALADAETCARVFCALFARLCAQRGDGRRGARAAAPARRRRRAARAATDGGRAARGRGARRRRPDLAACPTSPASTSSATPRARSLYVGKSVALRTRARSHFAPSSAVRRLDGAGRDGRPPRRRTPSSARSCSSSRLIRALRPPGNVRLKHDDRYVYLRCRLDIALPGARGRARRRRPGTAVTSGRCAGARGASSCSSSSTRCSGCATAGARCRAATIRRPTGRWAAACRRASATSTRTSTAAGSTRRSRCSPARATAAPRCSRTSTAEMRAAAAEQRFERAAWLRRRRERLRGPARAASAACSRRRTRGRGSCSPRTRAASASTRSGSSAGASSTGAPLADLDDLARAHGARRCAAGDGRGADRARSRPTRSTRRASSRPGWRASGGDADLAELPARRPSAARARDGASSGAPAGGVAA